MKRRILLVVTGDMEAKGLVGSLEQIFDAEFVTRKVLGFTSTDCSLPLEDRPNIRSNVEKFVDVLRTALEQPVRRKDKPYDFVIGLEDIELDNIENPANVTRYVLETLESVLGRLSHPDATRTRELLAEQCSFHLFAPMPETYFFSDPRALITAGQLPEKKNRFNARTRDVEAFLVQDEDYLRSTDVQGIEGHWRRPDRARHPKRYLKFLSDPSEAPEDAEEARRLWDEIGCGFKETTTGAKALCALDWYAVMQNPRHACFVRSLFADIAHMLDIPDRFPGNCHEVTWSKARNKLLRNI